MAVRLKNTESAGGSLCLLQRRNVVPYQLYTNQTEIGMARCVQLICLI